MKALSTILLLITSNVFMTFAWYGHLKLQEMKISSGWPLILVILFSWGVAFFEYCAQVPANRIGFVENGGPFNLMQLKVIQEVISLTVFTVVVNLMFKNQGLEWNHFVAFFFLVLGPPALICVQNQLFYRDASVCKIQFPEILIAGFEVCINVQTFHQHGDGLVGFSVIKCDGVSGSDVLPLLIIQTVLPTLLPGFDGFKIFGVQPHFMIHITHLLYESWVDVVERT